MNLFGMLEVSGSALGAERWRAEVVAANMANSETTRTAQGGAYRRQMLVFRAQPMPRFPLLLAGLRKATPDGGVRVERVVADTSPLPRRYEPGHPDADAAGYVTYPNVNPVMEMADLLSAVRAYQLNAAAVQAAEEHDPAVPADSDVKDNC